MEDKKILEELKKQNQFFKDLIVFLLSKERYSDSQIREIVGKVDNNRIRKISAGIKKIPKK